MISKLQGVKNVFDEAIKKVITPAKKNHKLESVKKNHKLESVKKKNHKLELEAKLRLKKNIKKHRDLGELKEAVADEDFDVNDQSEVGSLLHVAAEANNPKAIRILL